MDIAGLAVGILGLIVSLSGFIIAVWQIRRTRTAAESAERAAIEAREAVLYVTSVSDLSQASAQIEQIKELHRTQDWRRAADRYTPLRQLLIRAASRLPEENQQVFNFAVVQLREMETDVNLALDRNIPLSSTRFISILLEVQHSLDEVRTELEKYLLGASNARTH